MRCAVRIMRQAISPRLAMRILENKGLHPEHAESRRLHRRVQRGGDAEAQDHARISGIDDAVIPKPCAGIIGMALMLELLADWRLHRLFVFWRPAFARGFDIVAPHLREHARRLL